MNKNYVPPGFKSDGFHCPHCNTFAMQDFNHLFYAKKSKIGYTFVDNIGYTFVDNLDIAFCSRCSKYSIWQSKDMIYPDSSRIDLPNQDLNEEIKKDYLEAASIAYKSPRGACAILRLVLDKLCKELCEQCGNKVGNLNDNIATLIREGLPKEIGQALDTVRVIGNEAVHIGEMNLKDDKETAVKLFYLINRIATNRITDVKEHEAMFNNLPLDKLEGIKNRNKTNNQK